MENKILHLIEINELSLNHLTYILNQNVSYHIYIICMYIAHMQLAIESTWIFKELQIKKHLSRFK